MGPENMGLHSPSFRPLDDAKVHRLGCGTHDVTSHESHHMTDDQVISPRLVSSPILSYPLLASGIVSLFAEGGERHVYADHRRVMRDGQHILYMTVGESRRAC